MAAAAPPAKSGGRLVHPLPPEAPQPMGPAHPPPQPPPAQAATPSSRYQPQDRPDPAGSKIFSYFCILFLGAICSLGAIVIVFYILAIISMPADPDFQVRSLTLTSLNISYVSRDAERVTGTWNVTVLARNPNHFLLRFTRDPEVIIVYGDAVVLGAATVPKCKLPGKHSAEWRVIDAVADASLSVGACGAMKEEIRLRGGMELGVKLDVWYKTFVPLYIVRDSIKFRWPLVNVTLVPTSDFTAARWH